jgi:hypothetical protein
MEVRVGIIINFSATGAFIATIHRHAIFFDGIVAVQGLGQRAGKNFEFLKLFAGKQIRVAEAAARERALQKLHALLVGEKLERHSAKMVPRDGADAK